ncbi:hypothetical protein [Candidatus Palauibacter sp.]|uniref:hypothetical protein n=1 Tax=Candidatus Palauibacter sp. TaxID=3101350 RepID=UPI003B0276C2
MFHLRANWYESVSEMQEDLDAYIETYNRNRPHRGCGIAGGNVAVTRAWADLVARRPPVRVARCSPPKTAALAQGWLAKMMMILGILLISTVVVALMLGHLARMSFLERVLQTAAMLAAAFIFFGLVVLLESATP